MYTEPSGDPAHHRAPDWLAFGIEHLQLSSHLTASLKVKGIHTLGDACQAVEGALPDRIPFIAELSESIAQLRACTSAGKIDWRRYWEKLGIQPRQLAVALPEFDRLAEAAGHTTVNRQTFGNAGALLQATGIQTLAELVGALRKGIPRIRGLGSTKVNELFGQLSTMAEELETDGACPDQAQNGDAQRQADVLPFAKRPGLTLLPAHGVNSGRELLVVLPEVLQGVMPFLRDESYRDILAHRLSKPPQEQQTLEEIALRSIPPVTRERIRQKEQKLLNELTGALLWNSSGRLGVAFHPTFAAWWRRAASEFEGVDEIGFEEFVGRLAHCWEVSADALVQHLPFILAIVTGESRMPAAFRAGARLDSRLLRLEQAASATPIVRFRLGRHTRRLTDRGIANLGDFVRLAASGQLHPELLASLDAIAKSITSDGAVDWAVYADTIGLPPLPFQRPLSAKAFVLEFRDAMIALLRTLFKSERPARIFALRTSSPAGRRMTLQRVAEEIGTYQSTVKRDETVFLESLHDVLVEHEFAEVPVWIDQAWLSYWSEARLAFSGCGDDYKYFIGSLALRWQLPVDEVELAGAGLWAVFTGYPEGRRRRLPSVLGGEDPMEPLVAMRIQLRGFRRVH